MPPIQTRGDARSRQVGVLLPLPFDEPFTYRVPDDVDAELGISSKCRSVRGEWREWSGTGGMEMSRRKN